MNAVDEGLVADARARTRELVDALNAAGLGLADLDALRGKQPGLTEIHQAWVLSMARLIRALGETEGVLVDTAPRRDKIRITQRAYRMIGY